LSLSLDDYAIEDRADHQRSYETDADKQHLQRVIEECVTGGLQWVGDDLGERNSGACIDYGSRCVYHGGYKCYRTALNSGLF